MSDKPITPRSGRAQRRDGLATRGVILEAAGRVFAERGFSDVTGKEICERANVNSAAVNYYFGGKEKLYAAVLREAHRQLLSQDDINKIAESDSPPEEKLRAFIARLVHTASASADLWGIRVILRELASPSEHALDAMIPAVLPKAARLREVVAAITGLPPDSVVAQRATLFAILPCISLILFPETLRTKVLPATAAGGEGMLDDILRYVTGGLRAMGDARRT